MFFIDSYSKGLRSNINKDEAQIRKLVSTFFDLCNESLGVQYPEEVKRMRKSPDRIREVFRHSLCMALDLHSACAYPEMVVLTEVCADVFKKKLEGYSTGNINHRQGLLQLGMHYIVIATNSSKKERLGDKIVY